MKTKIEFNGRFKHKVAAGVDEVNYCTSLAGDCVVAAVWLPLDEKDRIEGIDDSKKLTPEKRISLFAQITKKGLVAVVPATVNLINNIGLYHSRTWAVAMAMEMLYKIALTKGKVIKRFLIDGKKFANHTDIPDSKLMFIVDGDERSYLIGAASIVAKVYVDALFEGWNRNWPGYGLNHNHGSLSTEHRLALKSRGLSPVHRAGYAKGWWEKILGTEQGQFSANKGESRNEKDKKPRYK